MTTPRLSDRNLVGYFKQLFKIPGLSSCRTGQEALTVISQDDTVKAPFGLTDECMLVYPRLNVVGSMQKLTFASNLVRFVMEAGDEGYFLVSDESLSGVDSLFLCTGIFVPFGDRTILASDLPYVIKMWAAECTNPRILINGATDRSSKDTVCVIAAQLKTLVDK